jgi:hypothetical protein
MTCCTSLPAPVLLVDAATQQLGPQLSGLALADDVEPTADDLLHAMHAAGCDEDHENYDADDDDGGWRACARREHLEQHLNSPPPGTPRCYCDAF